MMGRLASVALGCLTALGAMAGPTNTLSEAEIQGRQLAQQIRERLEQPPTKNQTNTGALIIDDGQGRRTRIPVQFRTAASAAGWLTTFETTAGSNRVALTVIRKAGESNRYELCNGSSRPEILTGNGTVIPFAGSDFWVADLGLEFFYWPEQKILKPYEMRRGCSCKVLESINPNPPPHGYSRVVSWIDNETLGIVQAEAYGAKGKLLKEFYPKDFKKVNEQWEMGEMEMINDRTGSRTWIKFDWKRHG